MAAPISPDTAVSRRIATSRIVRSMGCASSVPPSGAPQDAIVPSKSEQPVPQVPAPLPLISSEAKYFKGNVDKETTSLFCDDDGCATIATVNNDIPEDATSAHRYVDFVARERRSIAQSAAEPSAFAAAISHKYRIARAYVKYGITGDVDQYQDEVDRAVPVFSSRAKNRVWDWLRSVVQAPPRGTRVETVRLFKRVHRGSVLSLSGTHQPDIKRSMSLSRITMGGPESRSGLGPVSPAGGATAQVHTFADDVLDELLMGSPNNNSPNTNRDLSIGRGESQGADPHASLPHKSVTPERSALVGGEAHGSVSRSTLVANSVEVIPYYRGDINEEAAFALPSNFGLVAESFAVGTVIGMEGDHQYDLIVVEEDAEVIEDEQEVVVLVVNNTLHVPGGDALLSPHTYTNQYLGTSSSSHRDTTSSLNSKERFDYMSVSQHSLVGGPDGDVTYSKEVPNSARVPAKANAPDAENAAASSVVVESVPIRPTGRSHPKPTQREYGSDVEDIESDPIYRSIRTHNAAQGLPTLSAGEAPRDDSTSPKIEKTKSWVGA